MWFEDLDEEFADFMNSKQRYQNDVINKTGKDIRLTLNITVWESVFGATKGIVY